MNQCQFDVLLLEILVKKKGLNDLDMPSFEPIPAQFYDPFEHFKDKIDEKDYVSFINKMNSSNLLSYDSHGYPKEYRNHWTIEPTTKALNWLRELNRI